MGSIINPSKPPILGKLSAKRYGLSSKPVNLFSASSYNRSKQEHNSSPTCTAIQTQKPKEKDYTVKFRTLSACKLGISRYPDFEYNAQGGTGIGSGTMVAEESNALNDEILVSFDLKTLYIPPLTSSTTKLLGLPLPPFLKIDIIPEIFRGKIDKQSGMVLYAYSFVLCFNK